MRKVFLAALAATMLAPAAQAVTVYTDRAAFDAATTGGKDIAIKIVPGAERGFTSYSDSGVGISINNGLGFTFTSSKFNGGAPTMQVQGSRGGGVVTFASDQTVFGLNLSRLSELDLSYTVGDTTGTFTTAYPEIGFLGFISDSPVSVDLSLRNNGISQDTVLITSFVTASLPVVTPPPAPVSAIPEPATWAMLIIGFGLVGSAARRRTLAKA